MSSEVFTDDQVRREIRLLVAELTEKNSEDISDTAHYVNDLGIDSLMAIEMLVAIDRRFGIDIPEPEFSRIRDVNETVAAVMQYVAARNSPA